jgi:hypothetical protein
MNKFAVGDKVRCVDASNCGDDLVLHGVYEVDRLRGEDTSDIYVKGVGPSYMSERFELVVSRKVKLSFGCGLDLNVDVSMPLGLKIAQAALDAYAKAPQ